MIKALFKFEKVQIGVTMDIHIFENGEKTREYAVLTHQEVMCLMGIGTSLSQDGYNFISCSTYKDKYFRLNFYALDINSMLDIKGRLYDFTLDLQKFYAFYNNAQEQTTKLYNIKERHIAKIEYKGYSNTITGRESNLSKLDFNKKDLLGKELARLQKWRDEKIIITDDFMDYSFGFTCWNGNKMGLAGGIIWHGDYYSIHT